MRIWLKQLGIFILSLVLGSFYAAAMGVFNRPLRASLIAWPNWIVLFWFLFARFKLLRFAGFIAVLPVSILGFEIFWSATHPGAIADRHVVFDRSHYRPGVRAKNPHPNDRDPEGRGWKLREILIGKDGFRADPESGKGNPDRCKFVLIGDSMIYGTGLPYSFTLGPLLADHGIDACVFGITGNNPLGYLATLNYVAARIEPSAPVAIYLYAHNDFFSLRKNNRKLLSLSNLVPKTSELAAYFDQWRRSTFIYSFLHPSHGAQREELPTTIREYRVGNGSIAILYDRDPASWALPRPLNQGQRKALKLFFDGLDYISRGRSWRVSILIHPEDGEIYANFARQSPVLVDLDPRRADALKMCKEYAFFCEDITSVIYNRAVAEAKNPYFKDNRHFSAFGARIIAENYTELVKRAGSLTGWGDPDRRSLGLN